MSKTDELMTYSSFGTPLIWAFLLAHLACGWGNLGHRTIALLADRHLTTAGAAYVAVLLSNEEISEAAIWPDKYKNTLEGRYTTSWHFVDANDQPPTLCSVEFDRDCDPNRMCILAALANVVRMSGGLTNVRVFIAYRN
jgi:hypothetical protein